MQIEALTEHIDFLAMQIETVSIALDTCAEGLRELTNKPEAPLMLPAPREKKGGKNTLCPVCKKFCKKGETIHERCKEKQTQ